MINGAAMAYLEEETVVLPHTLPRLVMLSRDKAEATRVIFDVIERIKEFCRTIDGDSDPEILADVVWQDFAKAPDQRLFCTIAAIHQGEVIGHLLALCEPYCGKKYINIMQYSLDKKAGIPSGLLQAGFEMLVEWGNLMGAVQVRAQALNEAHARRLKIFYGFKQHRIMLRKEI